MSVRFLGEPVWGCNAHRVGVLGCASRDGVALPGDSEARAPVKRELL